MGKPPSVQKTRRRPVTQPADAPAAAAASEWTTTTLHLPAELADALTDAAIRRSRRRRRETGKPGRPSVSEIVRDLLTRHRAELEDMD